MKPNSLGEEMNNDLETKGTSPVTLTAPETVFRKLSVTSDSDFQRTISVLHSSFLDSTSGNGFHYSEVTLVKNEIFLKEYKTFYQQKKASNYIPEELHETFGFLLFDNEKQAKLVCQLGLCIGSSTVTTLGDPAKGVYISKYSDYLHPRPWYHGKSGYIVIFNLIKGKVKAVSENYTTNYTSPSFGYDCHVAANIKKISCKTSHFRVFELSQYYFYEFLGNSVVKRPRQILPYVIVAFQYSEPNTMSTVARKNMVEFDDEVLISPWKGQLIIQGQLICDLTLWSPHGAGIPTQLPRQLDAKYVMELSTLKKKLPESAFRKSNYLEKKVCYQGLCFSMYEVEISNKQGKKLDQLTEYIKTKELAIVKCLEDQGFLILLTSSALLWDTDFGDEHMNLYALFLFPSSSSTGRKESKGEDDISMRVVPILPSLHYALLEAKKFLSEEEIHPNVLVKHHFQEFAKQNKNSSLPFQNSFEEPEFFPCDTLSSELKSGLYSEKCSQKTLTRLKSYFSDPSGYALEITTALDLLAGHSPSPFSASDGMCDVGFSLLMPPDPEFVDSEAQVKNETDKNKNSDGTSKAENTLQLCPASNLRIQPKRKASMSVVMQNKKVNLCRPFSKKTGPVTTIETTVKLAKGQFPQKRKRGAEVLTAQFIQTTKLDQKSQESFVSESVPVVTNAKKVKKPETSPIKTVPRVNQAMKKPPQKQKVNIVKSNQNPRMRKQLQPAKREIPSQPPIKILSNNQGNDHSENTVQLGSPAVVQSDVQENCIGHFDSQALNMLADLALSSATSTTSSSIHRDLSSSSDLTQNNILFCKENSLQSTYDHEYHRLAKNQRCALYSLELSKPSYEQIDSRTSVPDSQSEKNLTPYCQISVTQEALPKETVESADESNSNSSFIAIEHSYALLTAEHSKKHLQQRGTQGPTFAKNGTKGPEAGTPVGKVMPFRHQHNTPPVQKLLLDPVIKHKSRLLPSNLKEDFCHSHTVFSCDGSFKVTCKCETEYVFSLDSKYTNNPLEKTVIRALHGPWNADVPDNVEEVKLILHMWVALFYSNQNKVIPSARKVVEHSNPAKYVSINSTLDPLDFSEVGEECLGMKRHSVESPLESNWNSSNSTTGILLACTNIKPSTSGLEERAALAGEDHQDVPEFQSTICSTNEVIRKRVEQELPSNIETPNVVLSSNASTQTREPSIADENENSQKLINSGAVSENGIIDQTMNCGTSVNRALENREDSLYEALGTKASTLQNIEHSSPRNKVTESQESLENKDGDLEYVMINLEPITFTFEKNACLPIETGFANGVDKIPDSDRELIKKVSPVESLRQQIPFREIAQAQNASSINQDLQDIPSMAPSVSTGTKYLCTSSVARETLAKETGSLEKEVSIPLSTSSANTVLIEAVSSVVSSGDQATSDEMKLPQDTFLQTPGLYSISSEEVIESAQVEEIVLTPTFAPMESKKTASAGYISSGATKLNYSLEKETNGSDLNSERMNFESVNVAFTKETCISLGREAVSIELSDDSDIELALTISPPTSPRDQAQSDEIMQIQAVPLENVELQVVAEEIIEPVTAFPKKRETNSSDYSSLHTAVLPKPLENKECKRDALDPVTLVLAKEPCALEIGQEVNIITNSPFDGALIEPVSPASIPDEQVPSKETPLSQDMPLQMLELHDTVSQEVSKASQMQSIDLSSGEEDHASDSPGVPGEKPTATQGKPTKLSSEMALPLIDYTEQKESLLLIHRRAAEDHVVQNKYDDARFFQGKFQCCDTTLNQTISAAECEDLKTSFQDLERSENPLQQTSEEIKSLNSTHIVLDTHKSPPCLRKLIENRSVAEEIHSSTESNLTSNLLEHKNSPSDSKKDLHGQSEYDYLPKSSLDLTSVDQSDFICRPSKNPDICINMDDASHISSSGQENEDTFQEHGISVSRVLSNDEVISTLHEESINLKGTNLGSSLILSKGEGNTQVHQETSSVCETKDQSSGIFATKESNLVCVGTYQNVANITKNTEEEHSASIIQKPWEASEELVEHESAGEGIGTEKDIKSPDRNMDMNLNTEIYYESLSGESDQECFGDIKHSQLQLDDPCPLGTNHSNEVEEASVTDYDTLMDSRTITTSSDIESWNYSHKSQEADKGTKQKSWSTGFKKGDKYVPFYIKIRDLHGTPRTYTNFTVTKKLKDTTRTLHNLKQHPCVTARCGLISSWTSTWQVTDDPTQNTLDLEYLRFAHKLKQMVKNGKSQLSTASSPLSKESHIQTTVGVFPLTKVTETPVTHPTSRSRSPLLVTIVHSEPRQHTSSWHTNSEKHSDFNSLSSSRQDKCSQSRTVPNAERDPATSFHLNKLKYDSKLKESRNDISLILSEYAEFNKVMLNNSQRNYQANDLSFNSGKTISPKITSFPRRMASYEHMITDLCSNLHVKLKNVIKEACKSTFLFCLVETEDSSFFIRTRSLLRKEGHKEIEPQHFCQALHRETDTLIVIIKNEDIATHVHQIPSLLRLKQFPSVMFAGVDSPGDVLDGTYQELFRTGGFVVSDEKVLEAITLVQLKEIVKILEKLNTNGRWKWLLHYRESKKLKEDVRVDSVAHSKNSILKSYQSANIIEVLHYHQCDSKSSTKSEYLKCLLNLQVLRINARFAVYLTDKLNTCREMFENNGILVTDINNFAGIVQKAAPFKATYW
ncbi:protein TASOR 2 isoform X1 [Sarcophilus harrisii]|uniref:Transcription activation suppressor family member 2 n=2 Tax=Sarcophilus harrisii TaxID=9305 RepID=A0A7N4PES4_SARHA|nr:protein TASOR 2 isoform X2 [Sarcophilus harrisii]XP_031795832.1 protein TASOR 2 isoform X1 [Sarcophilus harrisii]